MPLRGAFGRGYVTAASSSRSPAEARASYRQRQRANQQCPRLARRESSNKGLRRRGRG